MGSYSYVSLTGLKNRLGDAATTDDALYREQIEAASEHIDRSCDRTFRVYLATEYLTARVGGHIHLPTDLLAVTTLKTDDDGDRVYEDTWAATDYDLDPAQAASKRRPYWRISATPDGDYQFPVGVARGVEIVGRWGFWQDLGSRGTLGAAITDTTGTSVTMTAGHGVEALETLLIDSEQIYVTAVSTNTLTVERGVNGTTAATHSNGATVQRYRYPAPIVQATGIVAEQLLRPFHGPGYAQDDAPRMSFPILPHAVGVLIAPYRRVEAA